MDSGAADSDCLEAIPKRFLEALLDSRLLFAAICSHVAPTGRYQPLSRNYANKWVPFVQHVDLTCYLV